MADRSLEILYHLSRRGSAWPDASITAIQDLKARLLDGKSAKPTQTQGEESERLNEGGHDFASGLHPVDTSYSTRQTLTSVTNFYTPVGTDSQNIDVDPRMANTADIEWDNLMANNIFVDQCVEGYDNLDLFSGFDIPFWLEQNQY